MSDSFVNPWTLAHQVPLSMGFHRQEYWRGVPFPSPGELPNPGIEPTSPALADRFFTTEPPFSHKKQHLLGQSFSYGVMKFAGIWEFKSTHTHINSFARVESSQVMQDHSVKNVYFQLFQLSQLRKSSHLGCAYLAEGKAGLRPSEPTHTGKRLC